MKLFEVIFDIPAKRILITQISEKLVTEKIWSSPEKSKKLLKEKSRVENIIVPFESVEKKLLYLEDSIEILKEADGDLFLKELQKEITSLKKDIEDLQLKNLLSGEYDNNSAILTIHPGAGGIESQDWAQMLMRMYLRWAERQGYRSQIIDVQAGDEAGIKSATLLFEGNYAYGYLLSEAGVHRLVRISPFDANKRRHTSFAAVIVIPDIDEDIDIDVKDDDLKMDTFRASGAGGQHVNKTSSAVRLTHIPTGIVVSCQNERSQHKNRAVAMKILKARLFDLELQAKEKKMENILGDKKDIAWGSQIRSYILQPYRLVKDHRTNKEIGNVDAVLDGDIDILIQEFLKKRAQE